ncbi:GNAT family N-acetyltransferase [Nocardioides sp. LHD-245]|uniref:GNAT family N-acetyltransferase n=1 Tax=Nocardioides sp. LHD-245 TaxID=3051387 RepID=UPI0027DF5984|nr:GNAT family N-acetyltransferase [Nocardioides sp. LHD-245]
MTLAVRPYADGDWPAVAEIIAEVLTAGETYAMPALDDAGARDFWLGQPGAVAVAEVDGVVVGTAKMGPNRPAQGSHIGTASFMVSTAARGAGVGRALGQHVVAWHREHGFAGIQFNAVVATNEAAVALWRSLGFEVVGTVPRAFRRPDGSLVGLHVMFLDLAGMRS